MQGLLFFLSLSLIFQPAATDEEELRGVGGFNLFLN